MLIIHKGIRNVYAHCTFDKNEKNKMKNKTLLTCQLGRCRACDLFITKLKIKCNKSIVPYFKNIKFLTIIH